MLYRRSDYKLITVPSVFQIYEAMNNSNNFAGQRNWILTAEQAKNVFHLATK